MASFSGNIFGTEHMNDEEEMKKCSVYLQECLSKEELEQLRGEYKHSQPNVPWWKYVFSNVNVSYHK